MRTPLALSLALLLGTGALACAPRNTKTHYERWAEEAEKRKAEEAAEEAAQEKATATGMKQTPPASGSKAKTPPPPTSNYSSLPPNDTPAITRTATKSRVVKPDDTKDEDVIY